MHRIYRIVIGVFVVLGVMHLIAGTVLAYTTSTEFGDINITGKIFSQATWRTQDSSGFTAPATDTWDFIQHRNLLQIEVRDTFNQYVSVFFTGRALYEGLHDYGADQFEPFTKSQLVGQLREAYVDLTLGKFFFRLGRQNLSWGESDLFRLLDGINPLDMTFGILYEDLDERRQPIDMARADIDLGRLGCYIDNLTLEGFLASGRDQSPVADPGTPYAVPAAPLPLPVEVERPQSDHFRGGARIIGLTGIVTWSLGHYWSYPDNPVPVFKYAFPRDAQSTFIQYSFKQQQTTGGSLSFFTGLNATQTVVRAECAYTWDEGVFVPGKSLPVGSGTVFVPGLGYIDPGVPVPLPGDIEDVGVVKWVLGLDNNIFVKALNKRNSFFISLQAFGRHIVRDWSSDIMIPGNEFPSGAFIDAKKNEYTLTGVINTKYMDGNLVPEVLTAYDFSGVWFVQPSLKYRYRSWEAMLRYSVIDGNFYNFGLFRDRDQVSCRLTYYF